MGTNQQTEILDKATPLLIEIRHVVDAIDTIILEAMNASQTSNTAVSKAAPIPPVIVQATPQPVPDNRLIQLPFSAILKDDFLNAVLWIEDNLGLSAHNLICCMGFETGMRFSPDVRNSGSSATGLIQFMRPTAIRLGTTVEDLAKMDAVHQMNYVYKYFLEYKQRGFDLSKWNLGDCYMSILWPAGIGKDDGFPLFVNGKGPAYAANRGLDANKDGIITRGECLVRIRQIETTGMSKRRA